MQWYPEAAGLLPKWLYFVSIVSILNSAQAYSTISYTQQIYKAQPNLVTPLSARTFGTWTALSSVIRLFASLYIHDEKLYLLALITYFIAFVHFILEWQLYKTAGWGKGLAGPIFVSTTSIAWMIAQYGYYVK